MKIVGNIKNKVYVKKDYFTKLYYTYNAGLKKKEK